jgi:hypothetical protein
VCALHLFGPTAELLLQCGFKPTQFSDRFVDFFRNGLEAIRFGGAQFSDFLFEFFAIVFASVVQLGVKLGDLVLKLVG